MSYRRRDGNGLGNLGASRRSWSNDFDSLARAPQTTPSSHPELTKVGRQVDVPRWAWPGREISWENGRYPRSVTSTRFPTP